MKGSLPLAVSRLKGARDASEQLKDLSLLLKNADMRASWSSSNAPIVPGLGTSSDRKKQGVSVEPPAAAAGIVVLPQAGESFVLQSEASTTSDEAAVVDALLRFDLFDEGNNNNNEDGQQQQHLMASSSSKSIFKHNSAAEEGVGDADLVIECLRSENHSLKFALNVERNRNGGNGTPSKIIAGSQFRLTSHVANSKCENCSLYDRSLKKSKETIRSLKLQLARLEDKYTGLRKSRQQQGEEYPQQQEQSGGNCETLQRRCDEYELESSRLKKLSKADQETLITQRKMIDDSRAALELGSKDYASLKEENNASRRSLLEQQRLVERLSAELEQYRSLLDQAETKLANKSSVVVDNGELERLRALLKTSEHARAKADEYIVTQTLELAEASKRLHSRELYWEAALASSTEIVEKQREEKLVLEGKHRMVGESLAECSKDKRNLTEALDDSETAKLDLQQQVADLLEEIERLKLKQAANAEAASADASTNRRALEKAISSSVRLCVVAPTVNVNIPVSLSKDPMKFKSVLSRAALQEFLNREVFSQYSLLFKQEEENSAPLRTSSGSGDAGASDVEEIQVWISRLLGEMQASIEHHVNSAMGGE